MPGKLAPVDAQLRDEFTFRDGVGYVAIRAFARMLGVAHTSLVRGGALKSAKLAKTLLAQGFSHGAQAEWAETGIPDAACAVIAEYFAFDAQQTSEQARNFLKLTSAMGVRAWVREKCQGLDQQWAKARLDGKRVRHPFTQALQDHGCQGPDMAVITDNNNVLATGRRAKQLVAERAPDAKKKISGRQVMTTPELVVTAVLEAAQTAQLSLLNPQGGTQCLAVCSAVGSTVMELMTKPLANVQGLSPAIAPTVNSSAYRVVTAADF